MKKKYCDECKSVQDTKTKAMTKKFKIKNQEIKVQAQIAICKTCENEVYDAELSEKLTKNVIKTYNKKFGVQANKIKELQKYYLISSATLAKIIGCAKKTMFSYEKNISIPSDTHMTILKFVTEDFENLKQIAEINKVKLTSKEKDKVLNKKAELDEIVFPHANEYNGYVDFEPKKFINVVLSLIENGLGKTKLAKGLFVLDFNSYDQYAKSITGLTYSKMPLGPMPDKLDKILEYLVENKFVSIETTYDGDYKKIDIKALVDVDYNTFTEEELDMINRAKKYISNKTAKELSETSHDGEIWNSTKDNRFISYDKVTDLKMKI